VTSFESARPPLSVSALAGMAALRCRSVHQLAVVCSVIARLWRLAAPRRMRPISDSVWAASAAALVPRAMRDILGSATIPRSGTFGIPPVARGLHVTCIFVCGSATMGLQRRVQRAGSGWRCIYWRAWALRGVLCQGLWDKSKGPQFRDQLGFLEQVPIGHEEEEGLQTR